MSEKSQVLYLKDGEERVTDAEPHEAAQSRAKRMDEDGYEVLAVMDADKTVAYMNRPKGNGAERLAHGETFPIETYKKVNRDVEAEVSDSLELDADTAQGRGEDTSEGPTRNDLVEAERKATRRMAVEFALRMYSGSADIRNVTELLTDANDIRWFLEG